MTIEEEIAQTIEDNVYLSPWDTERDRMASAIAAALSPLLNRVRAEALREAADEIEMKRNEPGLVKLDVQYAGYYTGIRSGMESAVRAIRSRIEQNSEGNET